jgi:hypothetical protein
MRQSSRTLRHLSFRARALLATLTVGVLAAFGFTSVAVGSVAPSTSTEPPTAPVATTTPTTRAPVAPTTTAPVVVAPPARVFATGNARLDALLTTLPAVLFEGGAAVHFGYNPIDCCHAGGYNPGPNEVWVSERAFTSTARLTYVAVHELAHSVHLNSTRTAALSEAVAGAPVVRAGSPWDESEKVADCVAWVLAPAETAASSITYWNCPDPWRTQVRAALA